MRPLPIHSAPPRANPQASTPWSCVRSARSLEASLDHDLNHNPNHTLSIHSATPPTRRRAHHEAGGGAVPVRLCQLPQVGHHSTVGHAAHGCGQRCWVGVEDARTWVLATAQGWGYVWGLGWLGLWLGLWVQAEALGGSGGCGDTGALRYGTHACAHALVWVAAPPGTAPPATHPNPNPNPVPMPMHGCTMVVLPPTSVGHLVAFLAHGPEHTRTHAPGLSP